jgi:hypothetical protein
MTVNTIGIKMVDGKDFVYEGADANVIYHGINDAIAKKASTTEHIELSDGVFIVFLLANIAAFYFTKEDE